MTLTAKSGCEDVINLLLARGAVGVDSKNIDGNTPLLPAAGYNHKAVVELLMNKDGVDINAKNIPGNTTSARAAGYGHDVVVKFLMTKQKMEGQTQLVLANKKGQMSIAQLQ